ncbi:MAG: hypothetical protein AAGG00_01430 [Cyanobacteria bacterium P01_H01_bin.150]
MHHASKIFMKFLNSIKAMFRKRQAKKLKRQAKKYRQTSQYRLNGYKKDIVTHSQNARDAEENRRMMEDKLNIHKKSCPKFVNVDPLQTLYNCIPTIILIGAILINYSLNGTSLSTIAETYGNGNTYLPVALPIFLPVFEVFFSRLTNTKNTRFLRITMWIMIAISPMFLLAAIFAADGFNSWHDAISSFTLLVVAVVIDVAIVFGWEHICKSIAFIGERIYKSIALIVFHLERWRIEGKINQYKKDYTTSQENTDSALDIYVQAREQYDYNLQEYNQELKEYNQKHNPIPLLEPGRFFQNTTTFVNEQMGYEAINPPLPQQPQDQYRATNTPPSNNSVDTNREELDEPETEFNYLDLNIRDAEREVDGD